MAKADKTFNTLLKTFEPLSANLPPALVEALGSLYQAFNVSGAGSPGADLARVLASIDPAKIDPLAPLRELVRKHPKLFQGHLDPLATIETASAGAPAPPGTPEQSIDPFRTGAAGRPTAMTVILQEAERRIKEGEANPLHRRQDFAEELAGWWRVQRMEYDPPGPSVTTKTIYGYDRLGSLWRKFSKSVA